MNKNMEMMKKLIEEKKKKGLKKTTGKAEKTIGTVSGGVRVGNGGGLFAGK